MNNSKSEPGESAVTREILEGYVGVKFTPLRLSDRHPEWCFDLYPDFKSNADRLRENGMTPKNGGNMSVRCASGFAITASGCNLGIMETEEVIYVQDCSLSEKTVRFEGLRKPSSESFLHHMIYRSRPEALAVVHAHDPATAEVPLSDDLEETPREEPYGTVELARLAIETFRKDRTIIVLQNHGYVAVGRSLTEAVDTIISIHLNLLKKSVSRNR